MNNSVIAARQKTSSKLALAAFAFAFIVIMLGAYTRLTDAGLSCPDWPQCYGYITVPHTSQQILDASARYPATPVDVTRAWSEMTHRYCAGIETILILSLTYMLLFTRKLRDLKSITKSVLLIGLLMVQILLGALTVTQKLTPAIVLSHLLTGISVLSVLWWIFLDDSQVVKTKAPNNVRLLWIILGFIFICAQISLGGWVSTHYAGLACVDFPYCNGQILPTMQWSQLNSDLITIHMLHRIGALITASYFIAFAIRLLFSPAMRKVGLIMLVLLCAQLTLGILNIIWLRPVYIALMHQAVGILLLLSVIFTLIRAIKLKDMVDDNWNS